jgi:tetratricopeptide (TPR) repeat protein
MPILDIGRVAPDQPGRRWVTRAEQLLASGQAEDALAACDEGLQVLPDDPGCLVMRARVLHRLHRLEDAMEALLKVVALDPTRPEARRGLRELIAGGTLPTADAPGAVPPDASSPSVPGAVEAAGAASAGEPPSFVHWTDDIFGDLEARLRAREAAAAPLSPRDLAALDELERWLVQLTGASA